MKFNRNARLDSSEVRTRGRGKAASVGGGAGLLGIVVLLAVQRDQAHVSVELLRVRRGSRAERGLHIVGCVVCAAAFLVLAWSLGLSAIKAFERHELYRGQFKLPVWPFRTVAALAIGALGAGFAMSAVKPPRGNGEAQKDE